MDPGVEVAQYRFGMNVLGCSCLYVPSGMLAAVRLCCSMSCGSCSQGTTSCSGLGLTGSNDRGRAPGPRASLCDPNGREKRRDKWTVMIRRGSRDDVTVPLRVQCQLSPYVVNLVPTCSSAADWQICTRRVALQRTVDQPVISLCCGPGPDLQLCTRLVALHQTCSSAEDSGPASYLPMLCTWPRPVALHQTRSSAPAEDSGPASLSYYVVYLVQTIVALHQTCSSAPDSELCTSRGQWTRQYNSLLCTV